MRYLCALALTALAAASGPGLAQTGSRPRNLALSAHVSASSEFSPQYAARLACDGVIPEMLSKDDVGRAWAVNGATSGQHATFILEWPDPVTVAEIVYYGRTSWMMEECWKDYAVRLDDAETPVARGQFEMNAGPQRIPIPPQRARRVVLEFLSSYGGANPGAAEIEVYSQSPPDEALPKVRHMPHNLAPRAKATASSEYSPQYAARLATDGVIPEPFSGADAGYAWAVNGPQAGDRASFTLEWDRPVQIAEVDYYGRTAFLIEECWKDYELYLDADPTPVAKGTFELGAGPQRIALQPRQARKLTLRFLNSYGGANPGAAEIQVFDESTPEGWLPRFRAGGWDQPAESPELAAAVRAGKIGFDRLLLVERHELNPSHVYTDCCEGFAPGGGIYALSPPTPDGKLTRLLDSSQGEILDLDLSYDAREVVFSWRRTGAEPYHLFRMNVDGSGLTQLTRGRWHDYNACWLPDGDIAFISTRACTFALCYVTPSGVLHRMDRDGGHVRRLSANYVNDFTPSVLPDGRILYTRWEYVDRPAIPIQSLWTINPDGTCLAAYYGNRVLSPASFLEARPIPGTTQILCTLTSHNGPIRGAVGVIDRAQGINAQEAIRNLTPQVDIGRVDQGDGNSIRGEWENPYPLDAECFLVSGRGNVYLGDLAGRWARILPRGPAMGFYDPQPVRARPVPPVLANAYAAREEREATVYLLDVYQGLTPTVKRGEVKQIAVVEEVHKPLRTEVMGFGFQRPVISCGATYAVKRLWGYASVAADGSARFRVPADTPLYFMALDEHGQALQRMRSFAHFAPGEVRSCIGCHEARNRPPSVTRSGAPFGPPQELAPPEWGPVDFDYSRLVQPVLDRNCVCCHGGVAPPKGLDLTGEVTDWFNVSYDNLIRGYVSWIDTRNGQEANILQIAPLTWGSPASKLAKVLISGHPGPDGKLRIRLQAAEMRRILAWIDLNVPYYGTYEMAYPSNEGGRRIYPERLEAVLADVSRRRCAVCHASGIPSRGFVRLTDPEMNDFLLAPLAKAAGGRESCGKPVFSSKSDLDYLALLATFEPVRAMLAARPRMDMPGAKPAQANQSCE